MEDEKIYLAEVSDEVMWMKGECIRLEILMKDDVHLSALEKAVQQTQLCYIPLQIMAKVHNERVSYFHNQAPIIVRQIPRNAAVSLGTEETNYYPWSVSYDGNNITLVFHHGILDGRGVFEVVRTLMYEYALACGVEVLDKGKIHTVDDPIPTDVQIEEPSEKYSKLEQGEVFPVKQPQRDFDFVKKEYITEESLFSRLVFDSAPFIKAVKELNTSPFALISLLLFEGMKPFMDSDEPNMKGVVITDLRTVFKTEVMRNFVQAPVIDYDTKLLGHLDADMKCTVMRTKLDLMVDKEYCLSNLKRGAQGRSVFFGMPFAHRKQALLKAAEFAKNTVLILSYVGRLELPPEVGNMIQDVDLTVRTVCYPIHITAMDVNGKFICNAYSCLNTRAPLEYMRDKLIEMGVPCVLEDARPIPEINYTDKGI